MKRQNEDKLRVRLQVVCTERSTGVVLKVIECEDDEDSIPSWSARSYPVIAASVNCQHGDSNQSLSEPSYRKEAGLVQGLVHPCVYRLTPNLPP